MKVTMCPPGFALGYARSLDYNLPEIEEIKKDMRLIGECVDVYALAHAKGSAAADSLENKLRKKAPRY